MSLSLSIHTSLGSSSVGVSIKNSGTNDCTIRSPVQRNPGHGILKYDAMMVEDASKKKVPYIGPMALSRSNTIRLTPDEEFEFRASIDRNYQLEPGKEYSVNYITSCAEESDKVFLSEEAKIIYSSEISKKYASGDFSDHELEKFPGIEREGYKFFGTTDETLMAQTVETTKGALEILQKLKDYDKPSFIAQHYNKFICDSREAPAGNTFANEVQTTYSDSIDFLKNPVTYSFNGTQCDPGDFAYVYAKDPGHVVYLCDQFGKSQTLPDKSITYDTKLGTIVHEASHKVNKCVVDNYYTIGRCSTRLTNTNCTDTKVTLNSTGTCDIGVKGWTVQQAKQGKSFNLNMYTADCVEFLAEAAYARTNSAGNDSNWSKFTYSVLGAGVTAAVGMLGYYYLRRNAAHQHEA